MKKRILSAMLAAVMFITLFAAVSCSKSEGDDADDTSKTNDTQENDGFEVKNLNGYTLKVYTRGEDSGFGPWKTTDVYAAELTSEPINDAVYNRNAAIKEKYNFSIEEIVSPKDQYDQAQASILAQDGAFDLIVADGTVCANLAQNGCLIDLKSISSLDLSKDWWDQNANSDFSIGNKLYFTTGDLSISAADATWITTFNKNVMDEFNVESPYQYVKDGEWTYSKWLEMAKDVTADVNGDGTMDDADRYGIQYEPFNNYALFCAFGNSISVKDADDYPTLFTLDNRVTDAFTKIQDVANNRAEYYANWSSDCLTMMKDNRALFGATTILTVRLSYKEMESDFGILPMPKLDEDQSEYHNIVNAATCGSFYCIPITVADKEVTGYALDALCHESKTTLRPAYYDITLEHRSMRDEDSIEMLDIILASRSYDVATIYNWGNWYDFFYPGMFNNEDSNIVSTYASQESKTLSAIDTTVQAYKNNQA